VAGVNTKGEVPQRWMVPVDEAMVSWSVPDELVKV
jgi:hypothetical protein